MKKVAVILFPGSNCELEAVRACKRSKLSAEIFRWNDDYSKLKNFDAYIIPGGFSYEDRGRSGVVASKDPIMETIKKEALNGKPLLGICNGAQILVETGLIPGLTYENHINELKNKKTFYKMAGAKAGDFFGLGLAGSRSKKVDAGGSHFIKQQLGGGLPWGEPAVPSTTLAMALAANERIQKGKILGVGYYNDWIYMRSDVLKGKSVFNHFDSKVLMHIPIAHGEGRFTTQEKHLLEKLIQNEQTLFRYCDEKGRFISDFPVNPNGALYNLAGVCNTEGNILALMPHPERTLNGQGIFDSLAYHLEHKKKILVKTLQEDKTAQKGIKTNIVTPNSVQPEKLQKRPDITILVRLIITDNEERTLENTLKNLDYTDVQLKRQVLLGFYLKNKKDLTKTAQKLIESGEIVNLNKEIPTIFIGDKVFEYDKKKGLMEIQSPLIGESFFVTEYNNYSGKALGENLKHHLHDNTFEKVEKGVFWTVQTKNLKKMPEMLSSYLFHNPHSMRLVKF